MRHHHYHKVLCQTRFHPATMGIRHHNDIKRHCVLNQNERLQRHSTSLLSQSETSHITTTLNVIAFLNQNERLQRHSSHCFHNQNERLQRHSTSLLSQSERKITMTLNFIAFTIKTKDYNDTQVIAFTIRTKEYNDNQVIAFTIRTKEYIDTQVIAFTIRTKEYNDTQRHCFHNRNERIH